MGAHINAEGLFQSDKYPTCPPGKVPLSVMRRYLRYLAFVVLVGCAGVDRDCSSCNASNFGADWIVVQYGFDGKPINCWRLSNTAVSNESATDGIFWTANGHLVHISGWYNRVQVAGGRFDEAAKTIGVTLSGCTDGKYHDAEEKASP